MEQVRRRRETFYVICNDSCDFCVVSPWLKALIYGLFGWKHQLNECNLMWVTLGFRFLAALFFWSRDDWTAGFSSGREVFHKTCAMEKKNIFSMRKSMCLILVQTLESQSCNILHSVRHCRPLSGVKIDIVKPDSLTRSKGSNSISLHPAVLTKSR